MASTSASSVQKSFKYDVFLSFRGEDTQGFVDHLYHALVNKGIFTYKDDEKIQKGETISEQLIESIEDSRFYIIVFSKNYASSSWCLDELVKIMECQKTKEQTAYPIFYDVEPTEVRKQSGAVGEAFAKHDKVSGKRKRMLEDVDFAKHVGKEGAGRWRDALKEAADLSGWELKNTADGHEAKLITLIVERISLDLRSTINVYESLVGMETRVKDVLSSLEIESDDVRMIGIKGMGGAGKTTLARAVFDHISIQFEGQSFVENVRERSKGSLSGLKELQKQVLENALNDQSIDVPSVSDGKKMMKKMMGSRKVLVVLDDVDDIEQLEALAGEPTWFKPGSRIIITTRDKHVLMAHRVKFIHDVNLLSHDEALILFSKHAFGKDIPIQGYEELSQKVVRYAAGLPFTIKVLGLHLCGRSEHEWINAITRLKTIPLKETLKILELSYDGLEDDQREIFLDVACLLKGVMKKKAIRILESCGFNAEIGLRVLEQKSLITISDTDALGLHDHLAELGRNIIRRLHPDEPYRHNRLWIREEIEDIFINDLGTEATRSIKLLNTNLSPDTIMNGLTKMKRLRFLYMDNGYKTNVYASPSGYKCASLPNALRYLYWPSYHLSCLPETFRANNLVSLEMPHSNISQLWEGRERKVLNELRFLDLSFSRLRTFDVELTPQIERLDLRGCNDFVEFYMPVKCPKLKYLNLSGSKLSNLNLGLTPCLERLDLRGCNDFVELQVPVECPSLKYLNLSGSKLSNLNLGLTPNLVTLDLNICNDFEVLHIPVECPKLKLLNLGGSKLSKLNPKLTPHLEKLENLEELTLSINRLPGSVCMFKHLKSLELSSCFLLEQLPKDLCRLEYLEKLHISNCISLLGIPNNICNMICLKYLHLPYCVLVENLPDDIGRLETLKELNLVGTGIKYLPPSIFQLKGLCVEWSKAQLQWHGFTSLEKISKYTASSYVYSVNKMHLQHESPLRDDFMELIQKQVL